MVKKKKCTIGYNCSRACINREKVCRVESLGGQSIRLMDMLTDNIKITKGGGTNAVEEWENSVVGNDFESGAIVNEAGEIVATFEGDENSVSIDQKNFSFEEKSKLGITHNHPNYIFGENEVDGGPLSPNDVAVMIQNNNKFVRAVSRDFIYEMRRPDDREYNFEPDQDPLSSGPEFDAILNGLAASNSINKKAKEIDKSLESEYDKEREVFSTKLIDDLDYSAKQYTADLRALGIKYKQKAHHLANQEIAKEYGLEYTRKPRN